MSIKYEQAPEHVVPKCPFCKQTLEKVWIMPRGIGMIQQQQAIVCPKCESFLGYGSIRKFG